VLNVAIYTDIWVYLFNARLLLGQLVASQK
jgi:hypothetical protein